MEDDRGDVINETGRDGGSQKGRQVELQMSKTGDSPDRIRRRGGAGAMVGKANTVLLLCAVILRFLIPTAGAVVWEERVSRFLASSHQIYYS